MKAKTVHYARLMVRAAEGMAGSGLSKRVGEVVDLMRNRGDSRLITKLADELPMAAKIENVGLNYVIETVGDGEAVARALSKKLGVNENRIVTRQNPSLIGGVRIVSDRFVADASISGALCNLEKHLMKK